MVLQAPGAWAYAPLQERLAELKVPVTFIYGEHDWMQPAAGQAAADKLDQIRPRKVCVTVGLCACANFGAWKGVCVAVWRCPQMLACAVCAARTLVCPNS
jgi:hypothetical protein